MYARTGTLFEGRFRSIAVQDYWYLLRLCRHIHRNPVEARLVRDRANWAFSNYREWVGERKSNLVDMEFVHENFTDAPN